MSTKAALILGLRNFSWVVSASWWDELEPHMKASEDLAAKEDEDASAE